ncbi:unnamed protein product [Lactuca virosa]|uniref:Uncharacterized protein n=1 Tax=Lactuca virosa TaxID=75947 RepID=A0AAU9P8I7_9ASTR|nr:unnamed protein product [Lactuca virosa]
MEEERKRLVEEEWNSMISTKQQISLADFPSRFLFWRRYFRLSGRRSCQSGWQGSFYLGYFFTHTRQNKRWEKWRYSNRSISSLQGRR